jgi:tRNA dimethylallyltransferase
MAEQSSEARKELSGAARETSKASRFTLIAGPTASGKSALALALAEARGAIIVNADSMQVYRELRILTARPSPVDEMRVPHRLYGFRPAREPYSVADWLTDMAPLIAAARDGGPPLVIAGGTGLYFKALLEGLSPVPDIPDAVRRHWRREAERGGPAPLYAELARRDPVMAGRLNPSDPQRLVRALEVLDGTGRSLSEWHEQEGEPLVDEGEAERLYLAPPRAELYARCERRLDQMIEAGAIEEVRHLMSLDLPAGAPALRALGARPLAAHLRGELSFSAALEEAKTETRRYVKRQLTWARRNMMSWKRILS